MPAPVVDTETTGQRADASAAAQGIQGGPFSFKADGVPLPRATPATVVDAAQVVELVDVAGYTDPVESE